MSYPKQKDSAGKISYDQKKFSRTAKKTKRCNISPRIMRGGIRL